MKPALPSPPAGPARFGRTRASREVLRWLIGLAALGAVMWMPFSPALYYALCAGSHVSQSEADRNHDGFVSVSEAGYACNVASRTVERRGMRCQEFYNRVDWRQVKLVCESPEPDLPAAAHLQNNPS